MDKRYLILLGIIVGLVIIGLIVFWIFYLGRQAPSAVQNLFPSGFFPSGEKEKAGQPAPGTVVNPPPTTQHSQTKSFVQLTQKAVSGATFIEKIKPEDKTKIGLVRYIEKATGHIYDIDPKGGSAERISNITIPNIFETFWSPKGEQAVVRYTEESGTFEDNIRNFSLTSIATTSAQGIFLLSNIKTIASSPKENKIFYLTPWEGSYLGVVASFKDKEQKQIFSSAFGEWQASWPTSRIISLVSRPAATIDGYLYKLDSVTGSFEKILGGIAGLTALWSPTGESIIYSEGGYTGLKTDFYKVAKKTSVSFFGLATLPEKCVWSAKGPDILFCAIPLNVPYGMYPDDWYKGLVSFADRIWKIDMAKGVTEIISAESDSTFDFINLFLSKNEDYLFLQNKKDGTLWSLQI